MTTSFKRRLAAVLDATAGHLVARANDLKILSFFLVLGGVTLLLVVQLQAQRFQKWYWYDDSLAILLRVNCSTEYTNYLKKNKTAAGTRGMELSQ
jgi:hypothetical protein